MPNVQNATIDINNYTYEVSDAFINTIKAKNPAQLFALVKEGRFVVKGGKYYSNVEQTGITVERSTTQATDPNTIITNTKQSSAIHINTLIQKMNITDENLTTEFTSFVSNTFKVDNDYVNFETVEEMNKALQDFARTHQADFVNPNAPKQVTFTQDSDSEMIEKLKTADDDNQPAITEIDEANTSAQTYNVTNNEALTTALSEQVGETTYNECEAREVTVDGATTTTNTVKRNQLTISEELYKDKKTQRQLREQAEIAYDKKGLEDSDIEGAYLAVTRYAKQIAKAKDELLQVKSCGSKGTLSPGGIVEKYLQENNITEITIQDQDGNYTSISVTDFIAQTNDPENQDIKNNLFSFYQNYMSTSSYSGNRKTSYDELSNEDKRDLAYIALAKCLGKEPDDLLEAMAIKQVLDARPIEDQYKDHEYFVKHQAKDYVNNQIATQKVQHTQVHFSSKGRKAAEGNNKDNTDIGKRGRELVQTCATTFGKLITEEEYNNKKATGEVFEASVKNPRTGEMETKYFEFDEDKWKTFIEIACDPQGANVSKEVLRDMNMTLPEGRDAMQLKIRDNNGNYQTLESIIGNGNKNIGNRELNRWRHMVELTGNTVDANYTNVKRTLHLLKNASIGLVAGAVTAASAGTLGTVAGGALSLAGNTTSQLIQGQSFHHEGETFVTKDIEYRDVAGKQIPTETSHEVKAQDVDWSTEDQVVPGERYDTRLNNIKSSGIIGAIGGAINGLLTMHGVHDQGRPTDRLYDLTVTEDVTQVEQTNINIKIPQYTTVETRQGTITEGVASKQCKLKVTNHGNYNTAETMEDMVAKYYDVRQGSDIYNKIFKEVQQFNQLQKFGGMQYPDKNIINLPDYIMIDNTKYTRKANPEDPTEQLTLNTQNIQLTNGSYTKPPAARPQTFKQYYAKGTVK